MKIQDSVSAYIVSFLLLINIKSKHVKNVYNSAASAMSLQSCPTLCDPIDGSPPGSRPWDSPGKLTGVGCHFLLQCMKVKMKSFSHVQLLATPWSAAYQAPSMEFSRQEYWSGVPLPSPCALPTTSKMGPWTQ